jgi:hypothetical protein
MRSSIAWNPRPSTTEVTASPFAVASGAVVTAGSEPTPVLLLAGSRIQLKLRHIHNSNRIIRPRTHPGDANCKKAFHLRLPISTRSRNPLKKKILKPHE